MCGIVGSIGKFDKERFVNALESIKHRGPDHQDMHLYDYKSGSRIDTNTPEVPEHTIALGHRRLSIIDLQDSANQPMQYKGYTVIFNGEIYNYKELKKELESFGCVFSTNSDTEVLLQSYITWGESCVEKFNGMWAFSIYDPKKEICFFSRDRIGVKPLYYYQNNQCFYFASEIKALLEFDIPRIANRNELLKFLIYGAQENLHTTTFKDIWRFPAGCNGVFNLHSKELTIYKYFHLHQQKPETDISENMLVEAIRHDIDNSIDLRLRSDVPIGMALSGGVDSNIVVNLVNREKADIAAFSSVYTEDKSINETDNIRITVEKLGLTSYLTTVDKNDILQDIEKIVWHQDEPFDTLGILAQNKVYDLMHNRGVKVSLDGQGADEIYAGYPTYRSVFLRENIHHIFMYKEFFKCGFFNISNIKLLILSFFPKLFEKLYFSKRAKQLFKEKKDFIPSQKKGFTYFKSLNKKLAYDTEEYLQVLLRYVDRNSMQFSIESRGIFLDYKVIENALKIPSKVKIKKCFLKYILRKSYEDIVDRKIIWDQKKLGFPVPQKAWMEDKEVAKMFEDHINNSNIIRLLGVDKTPKTNSDIYWRLVNVAIWEKVFKVHSVS